MSEPHIRAHGVEPVVPGVWRWHVQDEQTGRGSEAYALVDEGRVVLVDPLPIDEPILRALGEVEAIVLTVAKHQRDAWRLRRSLSVPVYAPEGAALEQPPDHVYSGGDLLPGGLAAFHAPGPAEAAYALWRSRPVSTLFLSDLLERLGPAAPAFAPARFHEQPRRSRSSLGRLLRDLPFSAVCFGHGAPIVAHAREALERALLDDHEPTVEHPID